MDSRAVAFGVLLVGLVVGAAIVGILFIRPSHYYILTNANDTWFEISEYRTEGWNAILVHVYFYEREPSMPPMWEVGG